MDVWGGFVQMVAALFLPNVAGFIVFFSIIFIMVIIPTVFSYRMFKRGNTIE